MTLRAKTTEDPWPGLDPTEWPTEVGDDTRQAVELHLTDTDQAKALAKLVTAGCSRAVIVDLLCRLHRTSEDDPISLGELERAMKALRNAMREIWRLKHSPLGRYIFEKFTRADQMTGELNWILRRAKMVRSEASARTMPRRDELRWTLVEAVWQATGNYHDEEVSALIEGAEVSRGKNYSAAAHRQWRHRYQK